MPGSLQKVFDFRLAIREPEEFGRLHMWAGEEDLVFPVIRPVSQRFARFDLVGADLAGGLSPSYQAFNRSHRRLRRCIKMPPFLAEEDEAYIMPRVVSLSPQGRWLCWSVYGNLLPGSWTLHENPMWMFASIDGRSIYTHTPKGAFGGMEWYGPMHWMPPGERWVMAYSMSGFQSQVVIGNAEEPGKETLVQLPPMQHGILAGVTNEGHLVFYLQGPKKMAAPTTEVQEVELVGLSGITRSSYILELPHDENLVCNVAEAVVSPSGKEIAWLLASIDRQYCEIWASDLRGGGLRMLAHIAHEGGSKLRPGEAARDLKWTPKGEALSYIANKVLWRVAI